MELPSLSVSFEQCADRPVLTLGPNQSVRVDDVFVTKIDHNRGFDVHCKSSNEFYELFSKAKCAWLIGSRDFTRVLTSSVDGWIPVSKVPVVDRASVVGDGASEALDDLDRKIRTNNERKRVYLFHGPTGTGKTVTTQAMAGMMHGCVCVAVLNTDDLNDAWLQKLMASAVDKSIVVFENIDEMFAKSKVSLGSILSALDGSATHRGGVYVLTATDIERIDERILRPGRVDKSVKYTLATMVDAKKLFLLTFKDEEELSNRFAEITGEQKLPHSLLASVIDANSRDARMAVFEMLKTKRQINR